MSGVVPWLERLSNTWYSRVLYVLTFPVWFPLFLLGGILGGFVLWCVSTFNWFRTGKWEDWS